MKEIDAAGDLDSRYLALYLYAMKGVILPHVWVHGFEEFQTAEARGFISGDIGKGRVVVDLYCINTRRFLTLVFESKGSATMSDVESFLANLRAKGLPTSGAGRLQSGKAKATPRDR